MSFVKQTMKPGALTVKEKELIAVAVTHTTACVYCIDIHTQGAKKEGATLTEITESILIAAVLKTGSTIAHGVNALNAY
jgi:AhpD family alkylhydroperoxidase